MTPVLCFALDGTLVHRTRSDGAVLRDVFTAHGIEPTEQSLATATDSFRRAVDEMASEPHRRAMAAVVAATDAGADPDAMVETLRAETYAATTVADATRESLSGLGADSRLAVVTDGVREWQVGKLDHHGLTDLFDAVVASYDVGAHKPATEPFERVRKRLPAEEYVMVGDSDADVAGARGAGFVPIRYETDGPELWATIEALL